MVLHGLLKSSTFGQIVNTLSGGKMLAWNDQMPDYQVPERYLLPEDKSGETTAVNNTPESLTPVNSNLMQIPSMYRFMPRHDGDLPAGSPISRRVTVSAGAPPITRANTLCFKDGVCPKLVPVSLVPVSNGTQKAALNRANTTAFSGDHLSSTAVSETGALKPLQTDSALMGLNPVRPAVFPDKEDTDRELTEVEKIAKERGYIVRFLQ